MLTPVADRFWSKLASQARQAAASNCVLRAPLFVCLTLS